MYARNERGENCTHEIQWGDMRPEVGITEGPGAGRNSSFMAKVMNGRF